MGVEAFRAPLVAAVMSVATLAPGADVAAQVDATQHGCAELEAMVASARRLSITAVHVNPHSGERRSTNTFVSAGRYCPFIDEWTTQWTIRARDGEVCTRLYICLPRDFYDGPLRGGPNWRRRR